MKNDLKERVQTIQTSMVESARSGFSESNLNDLRVLIRLTVEFEDHLRCGNPGLRDITEQLVHRIGSDIQIDMNEQELSYVNQSTFSGIDSFCSVNGAYSVLTGATKGKMAWDAATIPSLKGLFVSTYREFDAEADFVKKCRLLLDLFKIQIVFAGVSYD